MVEKRRPKLRQREDYSCSTRRGTSHELAQEDLQAKLIHVYNTAGFNYF